MNATTDALALRQSHTDHAISDLFLQRWSPRAFLPTTMPADDLQRMLEAARWAPSAYNIQPWRFFYALRGDTHWETFLDLLDPFNSQWARNASALVFIASNSCVPATPSSAEKPSGTHSFDTGAAWAHLALQATMLGYQAHAMAGIHSAAAHQHLQLPAQFQLHIAVAIGKQAPAHTLPVELQNREQPSSRLPHDELAFAGPLPRQTAALANGAQA